MSDHTPSLEASRCPGRIANRTLRTLRTLVIRSINAIGLHVRD